MLEMPKPDFVAALTRSVPARPLNMVAIEATNRGAADMPWAMLTSALPVDAVAIDALAPGDPGALLLDVREPEEYQQGHVPGAINIPQAELASRLHELPRDQRLVVICQLGLRSLRAAQFLRQAGWHDVATVTGGTAAWFGAGRPLVTGEIPVKPTQIVETMWAHAGGSGI
jgi:rhodanese-related sulfurtransferase